MAKRSTGSTTTADAMLTTSPDQASVKTKTPASAGRCRVCDSTDLIVVRKLNEQEHAGYGPDGMRYTSIIRRRVQCRHCQQVQVAMQRVFDPSKWT